MHRATRLAGGSTRTAVSFDIDGVLLRGSTPLPRAVSSLQRLMAARVPITFLTNGGGEREWKKAAAMSANLGLRIHPEQVILSHTPLRPEVARLGAQGKLLILGCKEAMDVAISYGAPRVVDVGAMCRADVHRYPFKKWAAEALPSALAEGAFSGVFCLHDPASWAEEIQVTIDVLRGGVPLGSGEQGQVIPYYASNDDLTFAGVHPVPRLAAGAFTHALAALFKEVTGTALSVRQYGKPTGETFRFAEGHAARWAGIAEALRWGGGGGCGDGGAGGAHAELSAEAQAAAACALVEAGGAPPPTAAFERIWHVGDNPRADVRGANAAGGPWASILVRTGIFQGAGNDDVDPADLVVEGVGDAVDHILAEL